LDTGLLQREGPVLVSWQRGTPNDAGDRSEGFRISNVNTTHAFERGGGGDTMRRVGAPTLSVLMLAGLLAVASAQGTKGPGTLRVGLDADPPNMDPHRSNAAVDRQVFQSLFDKLVDLDQDLKVVPMLATSWTISPDGKTVSFKLRQGVKFQDGTPFDANAVKFNFDRM